MENYRWGKVTGWPRTKREREGSALKAILYPAVGELTFTEVEEPVPDAGEVVVQVGAVGICGSELEGFKSESPLRAPPLIMGHEFAGVRVDTGERVVINPLVSCWRCDLCLRGLPNVCRNREVVGIHRSGGFAERVAVPQRNCYLLPDDLPLTIAAIVEPVANAVHAFRLAQQYDPQPRRVGLIGAGMLGYATTLLALRLGVPHVMTTDLSELRLQWAKKAGVHAAASELEGEFDVVFDAVGSAETRRTAMAHVRPGGTCVWIGLHSPDAGFDGQELIRTEKRVLGTFCYHDADYRQAIDVVCEVDGAWIRRLPLEQGVEAFYGLLEETPAEIKTVLVSE